MSREEGVGHVYVVTGGSSGLGAGIVDEVLAQGNTAVILDTSEPTTVLSDRVAFIGCDVRSTGQVNEAFARIDADFGRVDGLTNCAGVARPEISSELSDEGWQTLLDIHLGGTMRCSRAAFHLLKSSGGSIVNVSSVAASVAVPRRLAYNSAKAGVNGLTRTLAVEWAEYGIRVNAVAPGYILTAMTEALFKAGQLSSDPIVQRTPLRRLGSPKEVASVVGFLHSRGASYVTGEVISIDGGLGVNAL